MGLAVRSGGKGWRLRPLLAAAVLAGTACFGDHTGSASAGGDPCAGGTSGKVPVAADWNGPVAVIFDGWRGTGCVSALVCTGRPEVFLGDIRPDQGCQLQEFVALAPHRAAEGARWVPTAASVAKTPDAVDVAFWLVVPADGERTAVESTAVANALDAADLYDELATGIALRFTVPDPTGAPSSFHVLVDPKDEIPRSCHQAAEIMAWEKPQRIYEAGKVNVYYVPVYSGGHDAIDCWQTGHPEMVFVSTAFGASSAKLSHELGHALGLVKPWADWGHVNEVSGFPSKTRNLMYMGVAYVNAITLGQIYRLNFDSTSWFHRGKPDPDRLYHNCQDDPLLRYPCPRLDLSTWAKWP